jgi:hypothetical protein
LPSPDSAAEDQEFQGLPVDFLAFYYYYYVFLNKQNLILENMLSVIFEQKVNTQYDLNSLVLFLHKICLFILKYFHSGMIVIHFL